MKQTIALALLCALSVFAADKKKQTAPTEQQVNDYLVANEELKDMQTAPIYVETMARASATFNSLVAACAKTDQLIGKDQTTHKIVCVDKPIQIVPAQVVPPAVQPKKK
jgi:hypothetical protein